MPETLEKTVKKTISMPASVDSGEEPNVARQMFTAHAVINFVCDVAKQILLVLFFQIKKRTNSFISSPMLTKQVLKTKDPHETALYSKVNRK